ncbi:thyroid hormone-induced protein B-like [Diadema setosum]|uniref:thyroid hormone-induced protein B-like n=1 Tax=Diadema setosum TaxID=31175 RepID=UPI003B3A7B6C
MTLRCYFPGPNSTDCDFEYGTCGWRQSYSDDFDWSRNSGNTSSFNTGPSRDHTTGYGYYMYIETSYPRSPGQDARLTSPAQYRYGPQCLTFWYHMYGNTINSLNVYQSASITPSSYDLIFSLYGDRGNTWYEAQINIDNYTQPFYITIEGVHGRSYTGDIAIDDIVLSQGSCQQEVTDLFTTADANNDPTTPPYNGSSNFDCDFEYGTCGWQQSYYDDFDWSRNSGSTGSWFTGPSGDHTTGYGYYMYIDTFPHYDGQNARLTSPAQYRYGPQCLTFWYHMHGRTINSLNVYKSASTTPSSNDTLFSLIGASGNAWHEAQIPFDNYTQPFYITMEGVCGSSTRGDIAIDDIRLYQGSCQQE